MKNLKVLSYIILRGLTLFFFLAIISPLYAQNPVAKVDLNMSGRPESEVNEPGYTPWEPTSEDSLTVNGVTFTISGSYALTWYKAGIQNPYYVRLANDGLKTGTGIQLIISGLPAGHHTLLTFHNTYDNLSGYTLSPIDIYLNGDLVYDNLDQSNRVLSNIYAASAYLEFDVTEGENVTVYICPETNTTATSVIATLNGFELNTPNAKYQAISPIPKDGDEHVNADNLTCVLQWSKAITSASHDVYFGTDKDIVSAATVSSAEYKGNQTDTSFGVNDLYSMQGYYWRIDEHDSKGNVTKGDVWYFRPRQLAFPGAEGYGRYAIGGRGGKVVEVTNLNDNGPGSLREAITNDIGPRTIVFAVSGIITLQSRLTLNNNYVTVAGQTAPGKGICIRQAPFGMSGVNDDIIRNIRVRLGSGTTYDGMGMSGSDYSIIDHCSISWTIDEAFSSRSGKNITLQRTLISEALNVAGHQNYPEGTAHGYAASISGDIGSFHHNLLAHCSGRNWSLAGGLDGNGNFAGRLDIFNNIVYNWNSRVTDGGAHEVNFVNNYYKIGPAWKSSVDYALKAQYESFPGTQQYYFAGNVMPGIFNETTQAYGRIYTGTPDGYEPWVDEPFFPSYAEIQTAREAYKSVLSDVGCTQPVFDDHDIRIINETLDSTYTYVGSKTRLKGLPDADSDVGSWEDYPEMTRGSNWDTDHDGLPNWWEKSVGLDTNSFAGNFSEANNDADRDGYTQLDNYLNWMAEPHYFASAAIPFRIDLSQYSRGYRNSPEYTVIEKTNCSVSINSDTAIVNAVSNGFASFVFKTTDASGSSMKKKIGIFCGGVVNDTIFVPDTIDTPDTTDVPVVFANNINNLTIKCYPNPANDKIYLLVDAEKNTGAVVIIHNLLGEVEFNELVMFQKAKNQITIGINHLKPGIYYLTIKNNEEIHTLKIIKNKN